MAHDLFVQAALRGSGYRVQALDVTKGITREEIVERYVFLTAGACGPCRFGTYVTEYRKALRDSGFEGFRVLLFQQTGGLKQATGDDAGLALTPKFFLRILQAIVIGDVLNVLGYRLRPYEVEAGATDAALAAAKRYISTALETNGSLLLAVWRARRALGSVAVDRLRTKPRVGIIGEFWAMTTGAARVGRRHRSRPRRIRSRKRKRVHDVTL
jgi:predicted nucleotide-binding protein (sugar kinase/HSP70/actin superfamily)